MNIKSRYFSIIFKKSIKIIIYKSNKLNYTKFNIYKFIILKNIINKILKNIITKNIIYLTKIYHLFSSYYFEEKSKYIIKNILIILMKNIYII